MDFLNHMEGVWFSIRLSSFLLSVYSTEIRKRMRELEEIDSQGKAVEVTVNSKEENF